MIKEMEYMETDATYEVVDGKARKQLQSISDSVSEVSDKLSKKLTGSLKVNRIARYLTNIGSSTTDVYCNAQGLCETETHYIVALMPNTSAQNGKSNKVKLLKINKGSMNIDSETVVDGLGHANSLGYYNGKIYVCVNSSYSGGVLQQDNTIKILNASNFSLAETWTPAVSHRVQSIDFNNNKIWVGGQNQCSEFTLEKTFVKTYTLSEINNLENNTDFDGAGTYQTIKHFNNMFLMVRFYPNCIIVFDDKTLKPCGQLALPVCYNDMYPVGELEDISIDEDGNIITLSTGQLNPTGTKVQVSLGQSNIYTNNYAGYTLGSKWTIGEPMTLYVDANFKSNPLANGSKTKPFGEIQEAVNCIMKSPNGNGYTISVGAGNYDNVVIENIANAITLTSETGVTYTVNDISVRSGFLRVYNANVTGNTTFKQPSTGNLIECENATVYISNSTVGSSAKKFENGIEVKSGGVVNGQGVTFNNLTNACKVVNSSCFINAPVFNSCTYHYQAENNSIVECGDNTTEYINPASEQVGNPVKPWRLIKDGMNMYTVGTQAIDTKGNYFRYFAVEISALNNTGTEIHIIKNNVASRISSVACSTQNLFIGHLNLTVNSTQIQIHNNYKWQQAKDGTITTSNAPDDTFSKIKSIYGIK